MLELKAVDAGYGTFQALFGVNLEVKAGEAVGVIGPNGAGKTTLMRVISGLIRPTRGTITMEGHDVLATPAHRIVDLGIAHVPESRRLFARLSVEEHLKMGAFIPAARARFGVSAADLTPLQAARLAAVLPSPNRWSADSPGPYVRRRAATIVERARVVRNERTASCVLIMDRPEGGR